MFTGIIEELGVIETTEVRSGSGRLFVKGEKTLKGLEIGDSVAVNGVCLTVSAIREGCFIADVMRETLNKTNLSELHRGMGVNLERALKVNDRLGGHFVTGHVDGVGFISSITLVENSLLISIQAPLQVTRYLVSKGSVAVDGISLTVADLTPELFYVSIIPHSLEVTNLGQKKTGDTVNLEADILAKYVERFLAPEDYGNLCMSHLRKNGFID